MRKYFRPVAKLACCVKTPQGELNYTLARSPRRRSLSISVDSQCRVKVSVPVSVSLDGVHEFIRERSDWIWSKLTEVQQRGAGWSKEFKHGEEFLFLGSKYPLSIIEIAEGRSVLFFDGVKWDIKVAGDAKDAVQGVIRNLLIDWYKAQAKEIVGGRIFHYSRIIGVEPETIAVRTQKRVWGNCHKGNRSININWQVVLAPLAVIDYVAVHELCHLIEANHSPRFWKQVETFMPDYRERKKWLRQHQGEMVIPEL
ncbi:MAG: M48 family metallopeptidase [Candidatus Omnitrophica bacterium]|nr:M48 family metallopeptidase [Candidatus Omnitrophota bacterium]